MRTVLLLTALLTSNLPPGFGQQTDRFVNSDYRSFFTWFHRHSQVDQLYSDHSTLYVFGHQAAVYRSPDIDSDVVTYLQLGQRVQNIAYNEDYLPVDEIDGYHDLWYHIRGTDPGGNAFQGYLWGNAIARGWRQGDITGDGQPEFVMLGMSPQPRTAPENIKAEIRVLQNGRLIEQQTVPGLCVFEECASSSMLRILNDPENPQLITVEASTMTVGCEVGVEKVFFFWNGRQLERIFHAEYTTQTTLFQKEFSIPVRKDENGVIIEKKVCHYSREDSDYEPVWECHTVFPEKSLPETKPEGGRVIPKARAK